MTSTKHQRGRNRFGPQAIVNQTLCCSGDVHGGDIQASSLWSDMTGRSLAFTGVQCSIGRVRSRSVNVAYTFGASRANLGVSKVACTPLPVDFS